jgi:DNA-binding transcriptional LysR family regulator
MGCAELIKRPPGAGLSTSMNYSKLDLITLKLFLASCRLGSITAGAKSVHLVPSAASRRLTEMEEELGSKVFYRASNGVTLTPAGIVLERQVLNVLSQYDKLWIELQDYAIGVRGVVRVAATSSIVTEILASAFREFLENYPSTRIEFEERTDEEIVQSLNDGACDIGFFSSHQFSGDLECTKFLDDSIVLILPQGHSLQGRREVHFCELMSYEFVGWSTGISLENAMQACAAATGEHLKIRLRVRSGGALCNLISQRLGIGVAPYLQVAANVAYLGLPTVRLCDDWAQRSSIIGTKKVDVLSPAAKVFYQFLQNYRGNNAPEV